MRAELMFDACERDERELCQNVCCDDVCKKKNQSNFEKS